MQRHILTVLSLALLWASPAVAQLIDVVAYARFTRAMAGALTVRAESEASIQQLREARERFWALDPADPQFAAAKEAYEEALFTKDVLVHQMYIAQGLDMKHGGGQAGAHTAAARLAVGDLDGGLQPISVRQFRDWSPLLSAWQVAKRDGSSRLPDIEREMLQAWIAYRDRRDAGEYLFENPKSPLKSSDPLEFFAAVWLSYGEAATMDAARADLAGLEAAWGKEEFARLAAALPSLVTVHRRTVSFAGNGPDEQLVANGFRIRMNAIVKDVDGAVARARADREAKDRRENLGATFARAMALMETRYPKRGSYEQWQYLDMALKRWKEFPAGETLEPNHAAMLTLRRYEARLLKDFALGSMRLREDEFVRKQLTELLSFMSPEAAPAPAVEPPAAPNPFATVRARLFELVDPMDALESGGATQYLAKLETQWKDREANAKDIPRTKASLDRRIAEHRSWLEARGPEWADRREAFEKAYAIYVAELGIIPSSYVPPKKVTPKPKPR